MFSIVRCVCVSLESRKMLPPLGGNMEKMISFFFTQAVRIKYKRTREAARVFMLTFDEESKKILKKLLLVPARPDEHEYIGV